MNDNLSERDGKAVGASDPPITQSLNHSITQLRIGFGIDFHRLVEGRRLIIGGVEIPHTRGLAGHSDADVLIHAVCDALLGAAGRGDIGTHFPDTDPQYCGISSLVLLDRVLQLLGGEGWQPVNVDVTVVAEEPKLTGHFPAMKAALGRILRLSSDRISLKATTSEGMGAVGRGEGISAMCVALIERSLQ